MVCCTICMGSQRMFDFKVAGGRFMSDKSIKVQTFNIDREA